MTETTNDAEQKLDEELREIRRALQLWQSLLERHRTESGIRTQAVEKIAMLEARLQSLQPGPQ